MNIPFLKFTKIYYLFSVFLAAAAILSIIIFGLNFGIDLLGGAILEVEFENRPSNSAIQEKLNNLNLGDIIIQPAGDKDVIIKMKEINENTHQEIISKFNELSNTKELSFEKIGPALGKELRQKTLILIIVSLIVLFIYIAIAFRKVSWPVSSWYYGIASIIALTFDILITVGLLAFLGKFYNVQFNIPIITALLTILGYTINDKVIIFDRVRENILRKKELNFKELVNKSLNETLTRSLSTGTCTLLVLLAIFFLGGQTLKYFSLALITGIIIGTYSSLFLASPLLVSWLERREKKLKSS